MAQKPDGKPARTERVTFTRPAAERIAKVVRKVEQGNRDCGGLTFERVAPPATKVVRMGTFTGNWQINTAKVVTLLNQSSTPNTVSATNIFYSIPGQCTEGSRKVAIAKDGTAWYYVQHSLDCTDKYPARELDADASCSSSTDAIAQGEGVEVLLNQEGCSKWWMLKRQEVVTDVFWDNGIKITKKYVWIVADPDPQTTETVIEAAECDA